MLSQKLIDSLKKLSIETNGKEYTNEEAREAAERLKILPPFTRPLYLILYTLYLIHVRLYFLQNRQKRNSGGNCL